MVSMDRFAVWLVDELNKRDWMPSTLANRAGINSGSLSHILNGTRKAGPESCLAIARTLKLPPEEVFRRAGLLPSKPEIDSRAEELLHLFRQLDERDQKRILQTARAWVESVEKW